MVSLSARDQSDDAEFARKFYPDPGQAAIAIRVRRVLARNLEIPANSLTPKDRLDDDLGAELELNPHLFWELEEEFGIISGVEERETFEATLIRLVTFQDLVEFVIGKLAEPRVQPPSVQDESPRSYELAIKTIPYLCFGGFLTIVVGILASITMIQKIGVSLFLSGFVVWGLANGAEGIRTVVIVFRTASAREILARPWSLIIMTCVSLFFLWVGGMLLWGIIRYFPFWK